MTASDAAVEIVPYDPSWPGVFEREAESLRVLLRPWLAGLIEHVGSTAEGRQARHAVESWPP